jgi:hypothetical protein
MEHIKNAKNELKQLTKNIKEHTTMVDKLQSDPTCAGIVATILDALKEEEALRDVLNEALETEAPETDIVAATTNVKELKRPNFEKAFAMARASLRAGNKKK